jgi:hypothetical protein
MPPFVADNSGDCGTFADARWLTDEEIQTFQAWAAAGKPRGQEEPVIEKPPAPKVLEHVSVTVAPVSPYTPDEKLSDDYRCFVVDPNLTDDAYVTGFAIRTENPQLTHHMILYAPETTAAESAAIAKDAEDPGEGYRCFGGSGVASGMVGAWAPGSDVVLYPSGTGIPLAANTKLIMQVHYNTANGTAPDQTAVDLQLEPNVPQRLYITGLADMGLYLQPGSEEQSARAAMSMSILPVRGVELRGMAPHMHQLGKRLTVELTHGDGEKECLLNVDRWDFHWQQLFLFETPLTVDDRDANIELTCVYDTTSRTGVVRWGEGTSDEMCLNYFFYTLR